MRFAWLALAAVSCGHPSRTVTLSTGAPAEYPGVIHEPRMLPHDFMVRQSLTIHTQRDGKPVDAEFDAVVQKQGDTLLILGLGPMAVKVFSITQHGDRIEFTQYMGQPVPFSPRNIVLDVHRVFFKHLPAPGEAEYSGVVRGELDGEHVEETWTSGQLKQRVFTRPGSTFRGAVRVELGPGCTPSQCEPESATLRNEWFGYTLAIVNDSYETL